MMNIVFIQQNFKFQELKFFQLLFFWWLTETSVDQRRMNVLCVNQVKHIFPIDKKSCSISKGHTKFMIFWCSIFTNTVYSKLYVLPWVTFYSVLLYNLYVAYFYDDKIPSPQKQWFNVTAFGAFRDTENQ